MTDPDATPKPTAEEGMAEVNKAAELLADKLTKRFADVVRAQAFEQAAKKAAELARESKGLSPAAYREACLDFAGWCLDRALGKEQADG